ncbi:MAG: hypothetical protein IKO02_07280, partial [Lentisphaeria bacterium]|nr:hypothetical protein [Lentisphaeria bacterium]
DLYGLVNVSVDGEVVVDDGGRIAGINLNGGTYSGAGLCDRAVAWCGAGVCLSAMTVDGEYFSGGMDEKDARGAIFLSGATFSRCEVNPSNGFNGHGGAIKAYGGGIVSAQDSLFVDNKANGIGQAGGAIALVDFYGTSTITGSTFSGNEAYFGGAIQQNRGTMSVIGSLFAGNKTSGETTTSYPTGNGGGAIELHQGATTTITGSTFTENTAKNGGAIFNDTFNNAVCIAEISGSTFSGNTADYQGGAIYNYATMTVTDSVFTGNQVTDPDPYSYTSFGGAIANTQNGSLTITGGTFSENSSVQGGAVATFIDFGSSDTANLTVTDSAFNGNTAAYGGGIYIQTSTTDQTTVSGTDFSGNTASYGGGAICECFGALTVTGGTFTSNSAANDGGAIAVWDSGNTAGKVSGATFDSNTAAYGGAISHSWASAALTVRDCTFTGNGGETTAQGGAVWNDANSTGVVTVSGSTFSGNTAEQGGAVYNAGNMKLENVVLATASDTVYNSGSLAFAGVNTLGAGVVNDGKITFSLASGTDALVSDLGAFSGSGTYLVKLSADAASAGATFAASAGTFSGNLSVKLDDVSSADSFTLKNGVIGNDLAIAGNEVLRLADDGGALTVRQQALQTLVPVASKDGSIMTWTDGAYTGDYRVEIAQGDSFDNAIRIATAGTAFDVVSASGAYSCHVAEADGAFTADSASWSASETAPRQVASNGNGRADIFFATVSESDKWTANYQAMNTVTGEFASITGKNRIRDTFTGSNSDANILYLSDTANGDGLFMDDIYSEFGKAARLSLIREVRAGAGDDVVDMTSERYTSELAGMTVRGGAGDDVIWGAAGGNSLFGDAGNDRIVGNAGDDVIAGGAGDDTLAGGGGSDTFTFGGNWGADVISQTATGSVTLWFESGDSSKWDASNLTYTDGANSVKVSGITADKITLKFGDDGSAQYKTLAAAGAFLENTAEAIFETEAMRTNGILASL